MLKPTLENYRDYALFLVEALIPQKAINEHDKSISEMRDYMISLIEYQYEQKSITKVKKVVSELELWVRNVNSSFLFFVKDDIKSMFNIRIDSNKEEQKVKSILKYGLIKTEKEYRLVRSYIEIFEMDKSKQKIVTKLMILLDEFDLGKTMKRKTKAPRPKK